MKTFIKSKLNESLKNYTPNEVNEDVVDKWELLENDVTTALTPIIEKYKGQFGIDSYGVIDAIEQVFSQMFAKVKK